MQTPRRGSSSITAIAIATLRPADGSAAANVLVEVMSSASSATARGRCQKQQRHSVASPARNETYDRDGGGGKRYASRARQSDPKQVRTDGKRRTTGR